jgi:hypothetical protein
MKTLTNHPSISSSCNVLLHFNNIDSLKSRNSFVCDFLCFCTIRWIDDTREMCSAFILKLSNNSKRPFLNVRLGSIPDGSFVNHNSNCCKPDCYKNLSHTTTLINHKLRVSVAPLMYSSKWAFDSLVVSSPTFSNPHRTLFPFRW